MAGTRGSAQMLTPPLSLISFYLPIGKTWALTDLPHQPVPVPLNSESLWNRQSSSSPPGSSSRDPLLSVWQTSPQQRCQWKPVDPNAIQMNTNYRHCRIEFTIFPTKLECNFQSHEMFCYFLTMMCFMLKQVMKGGLIVSISVISGIALWLNF